MSCTVSVRPFPACLGALAILLASGCEERIYQLELRPKGDKIERRLTLKKGDIKSHAPDSFTENDVPEIARIAKVYGAQMPTLPRREISFSGTYGSTLPKDVGGDGHYVHWESPLGRVRVYVERFRGNDDIYSSLEARRKAVDQIVDLLIGWFESELGGQPDWPKVQAFLDQQFRTDLQNLSLFVWSTNVRNIFESTDLLAEVAVRGFQYFVERNYFSYDELPTLRREIEDTMQRHQAAALLTRIRRLIVTRSGGSAPRLERALGFLSDLKTLEASWHRYFWHSPYFEQHMADIGLAHRQVLGAKPTGANKTPHGSKSGAEEPRLIVSPNFEAEKEGELLERLGWTGFSFNSHFLSNVSRVQATLHAPHKPFWTNGTWNEKDQRVEWSPMTAELPKPEHDKFPFSFDWPTLCFAAWDEPDEAHQKRLFGNVGLIGSELLTYCQWYSGLSSLEKREWDAFLPTVKKGEQPAIRLKEFRFSNEPARTKESDSVAASGAGTIHGVIYPEDRSPIRWGGDAQPAPKAVQPARR